MELNDPLCTKTIIDEDEIYDCNDENSRPRYLILIIYDDDNDDDDDDNDCDCDDDHDDDDHDDDHDNDDDNDVDDNDNVTYSRTCENSCPRNLAWTSSLALDQGRLDESLKCDMCHTDADAEE